MPTTNLEFLTLWYFLTKNSCFFRSCKFFCVCKINSYYINIFCLFLSQSKKFYLNSLKKRKLRKKFVNSEFKIGFWHVLNRLKEKIRFVSQSRRKSAKLRWPFNYYYQDTAWPRAIWIKVKKPRAKILQYESL